MCLGVGVVAQRVIMGCVTMGDDPVDQRLWSLVEDPVRSHTGTGVQNHV